MNDVRTSIQIVSDFYGNYRFFIIFRGEMLAQNFENWEIRDADYQYAALSENRN